MKKIFKKIIPYIFVLIILFGISFLSFSKKAEAENTIFCQVTTAESASGNIPEKTEIKLGLTTEECNKLADPPKVTVKILTSNPNEKSTGYKTEFEKKVAEDYECGIIDGDLYPGCFVQLFYGLFYTIPSALLWLSAYFFNVLLSITISSDLFKSDFLNTAWGVVRDLSNLFFLIVLLYIAIRIILDIDSHGIKKTIANVVVMALLINFSMFFTKVIIDTSNVLALVFYNKMTVTTKDVNGNERLYTRAAKNEKDISGGIVGSFNPTSLLTAEFFNTAGTVIIPNSPPQDGKISPGMLIMVLLITGAIMLYASYAFLIAGLSFLGRMIELFVLIVFSPFAFMSFAVPFLRNTEHIGWDKWISSLFKSSFMAPIFMFFMYFIFLVTKNKSVFGSMLEGTSTIQKILLLIIPALFILRLLSIATEYAKKGSGAIGESIIKYSKAIAGVALGAATGGAALGAMSTVGAVSNKVAKMDGLKDAANEKGMKGWAAKMALKTVDAGSKSSFDLRNTKLGQKLSGATGIKMSPDSLNMVGLGPKKGGWEGVVKRGAEKREKELARESELLKTKKSDDEIKKEYAEKQEAYDKAKKKATEDGMSETDFERKHGKRPVAYENAEQLNHARMEKFKENFAERGLVASLAQTLTKKVTEENFKESSEYKDWEEKKKRRKEEAMKGSDYNEEEFEKKNPELKAEDINKGRIKRTKMVVGAAMAVGGLASGVAIGGIPGAAMFAGTIGAGIKAGLGKAGEFVTGARAKGEKEFFKKEEKHEKKMKAVEQQINSMKSQLKDQTTVMKGFEGEGITENTGKTDEHGNGVYKVNIEKLSEGIAKETITIDSLKSELSALNNRIATSGTNSAIDKRKVEINGELMSATVKLNKLNSLKGIEKTTTDLRTQISKTSDKKHQIEHEHEAETEKMLKKDESGEGGHEEKKHEDHPTSVHPEPSGGGHGGGGGGDHGGGGAHGGGGGGGAHT